MRFRAAWKWITCACISVSLLRGQAFQNLATTENGSVLYFSSPIRQRGTEQSLHSKIFRWDAAAGFRLVAEQRDKGQFDGCNYSNFYELTAPSVSADGGTLAYTASRPVQSSRFCTGLDPSRTVVLQGTREVHLDGLGGLARSGRYVASATPTSTASRYHFVTDVSTGTSVLAAGAFDGSWDRVTDEGAVIVPETMALMLSERNGTTRVYRTEYPVSDVIIDRSGRTAVYITPFRPAEPGRVTRVDMTTGRETTVFTGFGPGMPSLSSDGSTLFFTDRNQLYITAGGEPRQVTNEADGIGSAIMSGNGRIAYAVTGTSRLLRIEVGSGTVTELASATPLVTDTYRVHRPRTTEAAVGSLMQFFGSGLGGVSSINMCGRDVPVMQNVRFQVPWDLPEGPCPASVRTESPLEHAVELQIRHYAPAFASDPLHEGFRGVVTMSDPAVRGEVLAVYMSGLGPVNTTGALQRPGFNCRFDFVQAPVEYAALAPAFPGFYQVNVRVPDANAPSSLLTCGWGAEAEAAVPVWVSR